MRIDLHLTGTAKISQRNLIPPILPKALLIIILNPFF